ncbi:MAG: M20/M25/M40 family metallo-hydrolase [Rubrobacteraceae bacterium]
MTQTKLILAGILALILVSGGVGLVTLLGATGADTPSETNPEDNGKLSAQLREAITPEGILEHERRFANIARENDGNRAAGTAGYDASAEYVADKLREAGYQVEMQTLDLPDSAKTVNANLERTVPGSEAYARGDDFTAVEFSGEGEVTAIVEPADFAEPEEGGPDSTSGCEAEDFANFREGSIALLRRGSCTFEVKVENATDAGATAALISNTGSEGETGTFQASLGEARAEIPVLATSVAVGKELAQLDGAGTRISVESDAGSGVTNNVIATLPGGDKENSVVVGAHLDSVPNGPGINDNGSGSATILEIAEELAQSEERPRNQVRFAFWGAEELGILGSRHYVDELDAGQLDDISVYLNFDMVGSPNYVPFLYGTPQVTQVFENYFETQDIEADTFDLSGRSDHGPFEAEDVPVGGIFSGDSSEKTDRQADIYGGDPGEPYDGCYHRACDDLDNLNRKALDNLSDAAAHATATFAQTK